MQNTNTLKIHHHYAKEAQLIHIIHLKIKSVGIKSHLLYETKQVKNHTQTNYRKCTTILKTVLVRHMTRLNLNLSIYPKPKTKTCLNKICSRSMTHSIYRRYRKIFQNLSFAKVSLYTGIQKDSLDLLKMSLGAKYLYIKKI